MQRAFFYRGLHSMMAGVLVGLLSLGGIGLFPAPTLAESGMVTAPPFLAPSPVQSSAQLFEIQCAGCHPQGGNIIRRGKTLKQKALKRYGMDSPEAISTLITQGKGVMSAFGDRLSPEEIATLTDFVLIRAAQDWK